MFAPFIPPAPPPSVEFAPELPEPVPPEPESEPLPLPEPDAPLLLPEPDPEPPLPPDYAMAAVVRPSESAVTASSLRSIGISFLLHQGWWANRDSFDLFR
uniref:Uncharacterized protein n=1 Tax=Rhizobium leguminosarum TaxID=384 RepID=A0A179BMH0_RHILE|nr:hypothetical protein A4U53_26225 [Rhizobium leguminosarum]